MRLSVQIAGVTKREKIAPNLGIFPKRQSLEYGGSRIITQRITHGMAKKSSGLLVDTIGVLAVITITKSLIRAAQGPWESGR